MSYFRPKRTSKVPNDNAPWGINSFDPERKSREPGEDDDADETEIAWEFEPDLEIVREIETFIAACTNNVRRKVNKMNVAAFVQSNGGGEQLPFLDAKAVGKGCTGKILSARPVKTPKFNGLFLDVKVGSKKFSYGVAFDRFDLGAIVAQTKSDDTDDWIGQPLKFVTKKGKKKGQVFVNVAFPKKAKK